MHLINGLLLFSSIASVKAVPSKRASPSYFDYGELRLSVTTAYNWIYSDTGTGSKRDVSVWHPTEDANFRPLGSVGEGSYGDPVNGKRATLVVGLNPAQPPKDQSKPALKDPVSWTNVWTDAGTGGKYDGSFWTPVCPGGYVSLGDAASATYNPPTHKVWCLREDLAKQGTYEKASLWDDTGSGGKRDVSLWGITPSSIGVTGSESLPLYAGTFRAVGNYNKPTAPAWVLSIKVPKAFTQFTAKVPKVTEHTIPSKGDLYNEMEQAKVTLPLTAYFDPKDASLIRNIRTPFMTITRSVAWYVEGIWENDSAGNVTRSDEVSYGFSKEKTESMEHSVGVSMTASGGIGLVDYEVSLNYQFTYSTSTTFSEYTGFVKKEEFTVPEHYVTVMFCKLIRVRGTLPDGTVIHQGDNLASGEFHLSGANITQPVSRGSS
ncbi:hypothetical protein PT974_03467 [Cladobotryum mycophilum]|uniref:Uncharacterized protein n=1 Tax=Cladobotryum mycophilum TaxID=491253 RepID=A0ABR0SSQ2_9HYPO